MVLTRPGGLLPPKDQPLMGRAGGGGSPRTDPGVERLPYTAPKLSLACFLAGAVSPAPNAWNLETRQMRLALVCMGGPFRFGLIVSLGSGKGLSVEELQVGKAGFCWELGL